jgi:hypothetical protein
VAPSRRENCRPGKRSVDRSKRQRWPRRTDPAPVHRRRHRIPARLNLRASARPPAGGLFLPVTLAWCEPREPLALGAPRPACDRSF